MIGSKIANFQIIEELGRGGMGTVYKARDINLKRFVAIKVLNPGLLHKDSNYKRFKNEAEISAQINHPNVATLYNFLEIDGHAYIVMEYVNGITLEELIDEKGVLTKQQAIDIAIQILKGISAAHYLNIMHRDLKPANIMISRNGYVKIMDFGIALMENNTRLTTQNKVIGTLNYMAPELFSGALPSTSSDLYAVGVMFYEMLTGKSLFQADSEASLMYQIIHEKPQFALKVAKQNLTPVLKKLVQKTASKRFPDAAKVIAVLEEKKQTQKPVPKIELPDLRPALSQIKRRFRLKTNFAKQPNIVKVSSNEKSKFDLFKFINQRFLLICLVLTTLIIILSANINSKAPQLTKVSYEAEDLEQYEPELSEDLNLSFQRPTLPKVESSPPTNYDELPSEEPSIETEKDDPKEAEIVNGKTTSKKRQEESSVHEKEPINRPADLKDSKLEPAKVVAEKDVIQPNNDGKTIKAKKEIVPEQEKPTIKKPFKVTLRQQKISLRFSTTINSANFEAGQEISLESDQDIIVDGMIVIAKKAKVKATISKKKTSNSGKVTFGIKFNQVQAINGDWLDLSYPEYSDIQRGDVVFEKGRVVNRVYVEATRLIIMK